MGLARECRQRIAAIDPRAAGRGFDLTASFGVAASSGTEAADRLITRADTALYAAKQTGRQRACVQEPHHSAPQPLQTAEQRS